MKVAASSTVCLAHYDEVSDKSGQKDGRNALVHRSWFIKPDDHDGLAAYRIYLPETDVSISSHFHFQDQFQLFMDKPGMRLVRTGLYPFAIQYADACSPYGPITGEQGLEFFVFRLQPDRGAFVMPESRALLTGKPGRNVVACLQPASGDVTVTGVEPLIAPHSDGLAVYGLTARPDSTLIAPDPGAGGGQYILIVEGSIVQGKEELPARSVLFVSPDETPLALTAGKKGMRAALLQYPRQSWEARMKNLH